MYPIVEIFKSLQGEGHFVGYPMVFIRLAGCSVLDCSIRAECDEAPWRAMCSIDVDDVVARVRELQSSGIVCVSGGEPTDHDLLPLLSALRDVGYRLHMETSGVRTCAGYPLEWLTVSPKVDGQFIQRVGHVLKIVVRPEWSIQQAWDTVCALDADTQFFHRYLQPLTVDGSPVNLPQVIEMLVGGEGYNAGGRWALSTQSHRFWGVR